MKDRLFADTDRALDGWQRSSQDRLRWFVPGRIEVLGKHTDYAGGRSLLCAVERGFCVSAARRDDDTLRVVDVLNDVEATFRVREDQPEETRWRRYPATVARRIARNFPANDARGASGATLRGADLAFASDLPRAAGLSSSTALIIAVFTVLAEINGLDAHPAYRLNIPTLDALASYLGCIENGRTCGTLIGDSGVGTLGGSQDHTAILRSEAGRLVRYAYSPAGIEQIVPLSPGLTFVVGASGVAAEKTGAAQAHYNRASRAVTAIMDVWRRGTASADVAETTARTLFDVVAHDEHARAALRRNLQHASHPEFTPDELVARLDHFLVEALDIVPNATTVLAAGDLDAFGRIVDSSQAAAERWLANQIPETIALARLARARGAIAASAFGAGFGGSVWALVREDPVDAFIADWRRDYLDRFPSHADRAIFFATPPGPARLRL